MINPTIPLRRVFARTLSLNRRWRGAEIKSAVDLGDEARSRKDWPVAAAQYRLHLASNPEHFAVWVQLGHAAKEAGFYDESLAAYMRAYSIDPKDADLLLNIGHFYQKTGNRDLAIKWYRLSAEQDQNPSALQGLEGLGSFFRVNGQNFDAKWQGSRLGVKGSVSADSSAASTGPQTAWLGQVFDAEWYLTVNPDVAAAGLDALTHFTAYGEAEGLDPSPTFSTRFYRETYMHGEPPDASPLRHYLARGRDLGYNPDPTNASNYRRFVAFQELSYGIELPELRRHIALMTIRPLFVVYLKAEDANSVGRVRDMLDAQIYDRWVLCTDVDDVMRQVQALEPDDWRVVWLDGGETLHSSALYHYASRINESPGVDIIYADEDQIGEDGYRSRPFFKPDWSPDYFESFNFIGTGACVSGEAIGRVLSQAQGPYDLLLMATEAAGRVEHIRQILVHRGAGLDSSKTRAYIAQEVDALGRRLQRTGRSGTVTPLRPGRACYDARLILSSNPLVSIVIPTAGKIAEIDGRKVDLALNCLDKLLAKTSYKNFEIIVVHNDDLGRARLSALADRSAKILPYRGEFNIARKLNIGAAASRGDYLLVLSDEIEPLTPDWLQRMLEHFEKPHVGVVGAKILCQAMKIQHAGFVITRGRANHVRANYPREDEGYYFSTCAARNVIAVTGAAMMTRVSLFDKLKGYTEALPANYSDVDYCLKAERAGYVTIYAPRAELIHHEPVPSTRESHASELEYFQNQWTSWTTDPYYNESMLKVDAPNYEFVATRYPIG